MTPSNNPSAVAKGVVVIDANVLIGICAREQDKLVTAEAALLDYSTRGWLFHAPGVIVAEVLYILCGKLQGGQLDPAAHQEAVESFQDQMKAILPPPRGDASLIARAEEIRHSYGCSHSADGLYIALAEGISQTVTTELLTFDEGMSKQAAKNAPTVKVNLLPIT